jgi:hypothetical protein
MNVTPRQKHPFVHVSSHLVRRQQFCANLLGSYPLYFGERKYFSGDELSICATESCFLLTILNNDGNLSFSGLLPNQVSNQNQVCDPYFTLNEPKPMKVSLTFNKFQK